MMGTMERRRERGEGERATGDPATGALDFAAAARSLSAATRRLGLVVPGFRTPPRLVGVDRTVRRYPNGATVAVRVRGRPRPAIVADMIDGVVVANQLDAHRANRVRADLWAVVSGVVAERRVA